MYAPREHLFIRHMARCMIRLAIPNWLGVEEDGLYDIRHVLCPSCTIDNHLIVTLILVFLLLPKHQVQLRWPPWTRPVLFWRAPFGRVAWCGAARYTVLRDTRRIAHLALRASIRAVDAHQTGHGWVKDISSRIHLVQIREPRVDNGSRLPIPQVSAPACPAWQPRLLIVIVVKLMNEESGGCKIGRWTSVEKALVERGDERVTNEADWPQWRWQGRWQRWQLRRRYGRGWRRLYDA